MIEEEAEIENSGNSGSDIIDSNRESGTHLYNNKWSDRSDDDYEIKEEGKKSGMDPGPAPHCFSLSTSTVWARCPGIRGTLSQHITKRLKRERESRKSSILPSNSNIDSSQRSDSHSHCSPYLEKRITFAIEANEETLLCVTRYINTGILLFPTLCNPLDLTIPLELIRLATDWGMVSLVFEVILKISYAQQYNFLSFGIIEN